MLTPPECLQGTFLDPQIFSEVYLLVSIIIIVIKTLPLNLKWYIVSVGISAPPTCVLLFRAFHSCNVRTELDLIPWRGGACPSTTFYVYIGFLGIHYCGLSENVR